MTDFSSVLNGNIEERPKLDPNHHLTYIFTSGTTGTPKGVIYTHKMVIAEIFALNKAGMIPVQ